MQGDSHFSHHHPLTSFLDDKEADDYGDDNPHSCKICGLPILSTPSYTCTTGCEFFLHKSCALKFRKEIIHPSHGALSFRDSKKHTLCLREGSPNFTYKCEDCNFEIHPLVAVPGVEIKTKHKSHPQHPLVAFCKENSSECDACGKKHDGFFFLCRDCNFWIHQDCTILPSAITLTSHPLPFVLAYSLPVNARVGDCIVCDKPLLLTHNAIYFRPQDTKFAHASCGMEKIQSKTRLQLIQLPDDDWDTFPSSEIRRYSRVADDEEEEEEKLKIEKFHKHPLILVGDHDEGISEACDPELVCDVCIKTINISSPFYRCAELEQGCCFLAHKICSYLLPIIKFVLPVGPNRAEPAIFCPDPAASFFNSIFYCVFCRLPCNGPCYYFPSLSPVIFYPIGLPLFVDLWCMAAPSVIKHTSHNQHLLCRTYRFSRAFPISCCSGDSTIYDVYRCLFCKFYIHVRCAFLPKRIRHEFDQHPLDLIITSDGDINNELCEVCEEGIDLKYWFYHCAKCDQSFHINCIPSVGYLSKVKFGGRLSISFHAHPLTLTRMLTFERHETCGFCHKIIRGSLDQMAFCCLDCGFWIHFSCARNSCASTSRVFEEIDEEALCNWAKKED